jgi:NADPH:quinone reductase-like Zn-dependent oxidoreductase
MKAVRFHEHGGPEVLRYETAHDPECGPGEALIEVRAASINHLDLLVRRGLPGMRFDLPHIPGADAAGVVRAVGDSVGTIEVGQRVTINPGFSCGRCEFCAAGNGSQCLSFRVFGEHTDGTYAELIAVPEYNVLPIPEHVGFEDAAAAPLVFLTAWSMMITKGQIQPGEDVLVLGAGGGVGTAAIQIAHLAGCRVWAAAGSEEKLKRARQLGADELINYRTEEFDRVVRDRTAKRGVDVVVDYVGADTWVRSLRAARRGGRILTCGATTGPTPQTDLRHIFFRQLRIIGSTMGSAKDFHDVMKLVFSGRLRPVVDRVMPLGEAAEAHRLIEGRHVFGKLLLEP